MLTAVKKLDKRKAVTWYVIIKSSGVPLLWKNIKIKLLNVMKRNYLLTLHFSNPKNRLCPNPKRVLWISKPILCLTSNQFLLISKPVFLQPKTSF